MPDLHLYLSKDSESRLSSLMVRWGISSKAGVIAKLIRDASEEDSTNG